MRYKSLATALFCLHLCGSVCNAAEKSATSDSVPSSVEDCVKVLEKRESKQTLAAIKAAKDNELYKFNRGLGAAIRNDWIWGHYDSKLVQFFVKRGVRQPDGMSAAIIHCLRRDLNNQPPELDKKISKLNLFELRQQPIGIETVSIPQAILNTPLPLNNGKVVKLADYRGKFLVFILFDRRAEINVKEMNELHDSFRKQNVEILGLITIDAGPEFEKFKSGFSENYKLNFPVVIEVPGNLSAEICDALVEPGILTYPETFLINTESMMIARYKGWNSNTLAALKKHIDEAVRRQKLSPIPTIYEPHK